MSKKPTKSHFRIIGDVHGHYDKYCKIANRADYSLQVGDMGFDYRYLDRVLDSNRHKIIGGNHDNYTRKVCESCPGESCIHCKGKGYVYLHQSKHFLSDYGVYTPPDFESIFYVRGAWSIDHAYRIPGVSWWEDEEIPYKYCSEAVEVYEQMKPEFMVTHTAPKFIIPKIPFERIFGDAIHGSRTESMLQQMYDAHQPKIWVFGHWHVDWDYSFTNVRTGKVTRFICLAELSYKDFPKLGEEVNGNK